MSLFARKTAQQITDYRRKCEQHLRRTMVSHELAQKALEEVDAVEFAEQHAGLFDGGGSVDRLGEVLVKSHFVLLKVEFELFLHLLALEAWRVALMEHREGICDLGKPAAKKLANTAPKLHVLLPFDDVTEAICDAVVPRHGLTSLVEEMSVVGLDIVRSCNTAAPEVWPQIRTAFEVRHLIEHRNGRTDERFRKAVESLWPRSSWGRRNAELQGEAQITVTESDLRATCDAMFLMLDSLRPACLEYDERRRRAESGQ